MVTIQIIDSGIERYTLQPSDKVLGRRYDDLSENIAIVKPESEYNRTCTMIVSKNGTIIDVVDVKDDAIPVTTLMSQYDSVDIGFSFSDSTGYVKNSEFKQFTFLPALKPDGFVPSEPQFSGSINALIGGAFTNVEYDGLSMKFYNLQGKLIKEIAITGGTGGGTTNYDLLTNKPQINGVELKGNKTTAELGIKFVDLPDKPTIPDPSNFAQSNLVNPTYMTGLKNELIKGNRMYKSSYMMGGASVNYYKLCELPVDNDNNRSSLTVTGRIGGWGINGSTYINLLLGNRTTVKPHTSAISSSAFTLGSQDYKKYVDIVSYVQDDLSCVIYLKCTQFYTFDINVQTFEANNSYDGVALTEEPSGTLNWTLSQSGIIDISSLGV